MVRSSPAEDRPPGTDAGNAPPGPGTEYSPVFGAGPDADSDTASGCQRLPRAPLQAYRLGYQPYVPVWRAMQLALAERRPTTPDALWRVEHPPVFTLGRNARSEHLLNPGTIPVVAVDRGGQVTLHAPGQVVVYLLLDLKRYRLGIRGLVDVLEQAIIATLADFGIAAQSRREAPGIYVEGAKIAALGLRIRHACSMHGLAVNVRPRLANFRRMNPCGYPGLASTSMAALGSGAAPDRVADRLEEHLAGRLGCRLQVQHTLPASLLRVLARG